MASTASTTKSVGYAKEYSSGKSEYPPSYPPKPRQYQVGKDYGYPSGSSSSYHDTYEHHDQPVEIPPFRAGQTQIRLDSAEVKKKLEETCFEVEKCYKPHCLPSGKAPCTTTYKPEYLEKPEYKEAICKIRPDYDDESKHLFERELNESLYVYPSCTIGKIWVGANNNYACPLWTGVGVLVGCDLIVTASHTAPWGCEGWWMRFVPAYHEGKEPFGSSYVKEIRGYSGATSAADDYVVCKLYNPLGDKCGWMHADGWGANNNYTGSLWNMSGYSKLFKHGEVQLYEGDDKIKKVVDDGCYKLLITHGDPCGWDGGILWGYHGECPCVIGILCGGEDNCIYFIKFDWAGGPGLMDLVT